jgi:hypothetical protein
VTARTIRELIGICAAVLAIWLSTGAAVADAATATTLTWSQQSPATSPFSPGLDSVGMAYDAATGTTVLFGGEVNSVAQADTWTWDGTTWAEQLPTQSPSARYGEAMAYDVGDGHRGDVWRLGEQRSRVSERHVDMERVGLDRGGRRHLSIVASGRIRGLHGL